MRHGLLIYRSHYLDRILSPSRDLIDHKYPAGQSAGKFARYGRSPVNWHARRIARWSARRFRCEIHFEANGNAAFRRTHEIEAVVSDLSLSLSLSRKKFSKAKLYTEKKD